MLPKQNRLKGQQQFDFLYKKGRKYWHKSCLIFVYKQNPDFDSQFGFVASKKIGKAHVRNRAKRLLREAVRLGLLAKIIPAKGIKATIIANANTINIPFKEICDSTNRTLVA